MGERRRRLPAVQPAQARPHARRGRHAPRPPVPAPREPRRGWSSAWPACPRRGSRTWRWRPDRCVARRGTLDVRSDCGRRGVRGSAAEFHARELAPTRPPAVWVFDVERAGARARLDAARRGRRRGGLRGGGRRGRAAAQRRGRGAARAGRRRVVRRRRPAAALHAAGVGDDVGGVDDVARLARGVAALADLGVDGVDVHRGPMVVHGVVRSSASPASGRARCSSTAPSSSGISQRRTRAGARFQCAVHTGWSPAALVGLLAADVPITELPPVATLTPEIAAALPGAVAARPRGVLIAVSGQRSAISGRRSAGQRCGGQGSGRRSAVRRSAVRRSARPALGAVERRAQLLDEGGGVGLEDERVVVAGDLDDLDAVPSRPRPTRTPARGPRPRSPSSRPASARRGRPTAAARTCRRPARTSAARACRAARPARRRRAPRSPRPGPASAASRRASTRRITMCLR